MFATHSSNQHAPMPDRSMWSDNRLLHCALHLVTHNFPSLQSEKITCFCEFVRNQEDRKPNSNEKPPRFAASLQSLQFVCRHGDSDAWPGHDLGHLGQGMTR